MEENNIWLDSYKILHVIVPETATEKDILDVFEKMKENLKAVSGKAKLLINAKIAKVIYSSTFRQAIAEKIKSFNEDPGYEKIAILSLSLANRAIATIVLKGAGVENIKLFDTEEEALNWLKL